MAGGVDMARGTHADATRHAMPRGRAVRPTRHLGGAKGAWTRGRGHILGHVAGGWQVKGPRVSGPW